MGEVYRATDTNLNRDVAIKVLPPEVAQDPERLGRFKREAHLLAALNHPNIAAIYGLEEADGKPFLALELVEGEDLKERLTRGAIPVDEALEIAEQVALALEEAHNKGIVHRDLKPANVKLTPEGKVKVLDFGLAKAWGGDTASGTSSVDLSQSPTLARTGTQAGVILGTAAYMSPEQARGRPVDKRADIWAFGVVLLEMLTGRNTFSDATVSDTLAAVLKSAPDLGSLPPEVPPDVRRVLERCLRKDPRERLRDIGDVLLDLGGSSGVSDLSPASARPADRPGAVRWLALGAVIGGLVATLGWALVARTSHRSPTRTIRLEAAAPAGTRLERGLALSPDGSKIALVARDAQGRTAVWIRALDALEARRLSGTEGARLPFWSPDGRSVAFFVSGHLLAVDLVGGAPRPIAETDQGAVDARGGAWSRDGTLVFAPAFTGPLLRVAADGSGPPEPATKLEAGQGTHRFPSFLPDGRHFLFYASAGSGIEPGELRLGELGSLETRKLVEASSAAVYVPTGYLVFARGSTMLARPFDTARLEFVGEPVSIGIEIPTGSSISGLRSISASRDGTLVYRADPSSATDLVWVDRKGRDLGRLGEPGSWKLGPRISPDGRRVVVSTYRVGSVNAGNLWIFDATRGVGTPLTFDAADDANAIWSPDGRQVAFDRAKSQDTFGLYVLTVDAPQDVKELVAPQRGWLGPDCWTPDHAQVFFERRGATTGGDIFSVATDGRAEPQAWLASPFNESGADVSPDGRWVAYASDTGGSFNVYVKPLQGPGTPWQVSTGGGTSPRWSPRGDELFYRSPTNEIVAAPVSVSSGRFSTGTPVSLFAAGVNDEQRDYDVTPDGKRFLLARPADTADTPLVVVLGFDRTLQPALP
jgi:Tol biopolymer transport system component